MPRKWRAVDDLSPGRRIQLKDETHVSFLHVKEIGGDIE